MSQTVTSLFKDEDKAKRAASRIEAAGVPQSAVSIWTVPDDLDDVLEDAGLSRSEADRYADGVRQGGSVVVVECDDQDVQRVRDILEQA